MPLPYRSHPSGSVAARLLPALLVACGGAAGPPLAARGARVVIDEVHYHPAGDPESEFVELRNAGEEPVDLSGWVLLGGISFAVPGGTVLPADGRLLIARDRELLLARRGPLPAPVIGSWRGALGNGGDRVELWTAAGALASVVEYDDDPPWPGAADGRGASLERRSPLLEGIDPRTWDASHRVGGTPGAPNDAYAPLPPAGGSPVERVELVPPGAEWRYLEGDDEPPADWNEPGFDDASWAAGPAGFGYGDGDDATVLEDMEDEYLTVFARRVFRLADPSGVVALELEIDYDDGFVAWLNGAELARANVGDPAYDAPATGRHEAGTSEVFRVPASDLAFRAGDNVLAVQGHNAALDSSDLSLHPVLTAELSGDDAPPPPPPPERPPRDLVVNEIAPGEAGTGWVELHNPGPSAVDAGGRRLLAGEPPAPGSVIPAGATVPAGGFLVLAEPELGFEVDGVPAVILTTAGGGLVDALLPDDVPPGHSTARVPDGGTERRVLPAPDPGGPNRAARDDRVVISEIHYRPGLEDTGGEFVELLNRSDETVDLSGWSFTRGIAWSFAPGTTLPPGERLVLARDPAALEAARGVSGALGPWSGGLDGDGETLVLSDTLGNPADRVRYADEGSWPEAPDGEGPSAELVHPALDNRWGAAWRASEDVGGTPGAPNSRHEDDPWPVVAGVEQSPALPGPDDPVRVLASVSDDRGILEATLLWRPDGESGIREVPLRDDGLSDDGLAENGIFGGDIPPGPDGRIVRFRFRVRAGGGQETEWPAGDAERPFLYRIEADAAATDAELLRPHWRVVMTADDLRELRTRSARSNELLGASLVAGGRIWHRRGIRLRGSSARSCTPRSYRVQFDHDVDFYGVQRVNLNGCSAERQWMGLDFLRRAGVPTPLAWLRKLSFNGDLGTEYHLRVEAIDEDFVERVFPGDDGGNLYRGERRADLDWRGEDSGPYQDDYQKLTNRREGDWSDIADLSFRFDEETTPDEDFPGVIEEGIDVAQWARYFAAFAVLGSTENSILLDNGDDYFLYHRPSDGRWVILPWDLDSSFDDANQRLFRPSVDSIERFLEHPRYAPDYWCAVETLLDAAFRPEDVQARIDRIDGLFPPGPVGSMREFASERRAYILDRIRTELTVEAGDGDAVCDGVIVPSGETTELRGDAPGCGTTTVLVDGEPADYDPVDARWSIETGLEGRSHVEIVSQYRSGLAVARVLLPVASAGGNQALPERIDGDLVLRAGDGPYLASSDVVVAAGARLELGPGTTVVFEEGASFVVEGTLVARGTSARPVRLARSSCDVPWGGIHLRPGAGGSLRGVEILRPAGAAGGAGAVVLDAAGLRVEESTVQGADAPAFTLRAGARLELTGGVVRDGPEGVRVEEGSTLLLQATGLRDLAGDGLVAVGASSRLEATGARITRCEGRGVAAEDAATAGVSWTLIADCATGAAARGGELELGHVTLYGATTGLEAVAGSDGGAGRIAATGCILWDAEVGIAAGDGASVAIDHSDVEGGAPPGPGNISTRPLLRDPAGGDFRLGPLSPCRGAGPGGTDMGALPYEPVGVLRRFQRCDANGDGREDLSDAVFTLLGLFAGGEPLPCRAAADCNADRRVDIADAIATLSHLFEAGHVPPPPWPACESAEGAECERTTCLE